MFCLLIHIKCFVGIYFIENKIFAKRSFSNYEPSKMVFHFFKFFTFSCFRGTFVKNFMKKLSFFNANFWNSIQDLLFCQVLLSQTSCYYSSGPFTVTQNLEKKPHLLMFWQSFSQKLYEKNYLFSIQIFKVHIKIYNTGDFQDLKLSATKMAAVSI